MSLEIHNGPKQISAGSSSGANSPVSIKLTKGSTVEELGEMKIRSRRIIGFIDYSF
jgi:hypothetical protein